MRKLLLLLFLVHCGLMGYAVPFVVGHIHGKHVSFVIKQKTPHYQNILLEDDVDDELEEDEVDIKSTPLLQFIHADIYTYVVPARAPGYALVNKHGVELAIPHYLLFQQFRI